MANTNTDPKDDRKQQLKNIEEVQQAHRQNLREKNAAKKIQHKQEQAKAAEWANRQVESEKKKRKAAIQKTADYKKQREQSEKEYAEFRKKKDAEEAKLIERQEQRKQERKERLKYMKELSNQNRWNMLNQEKERTAEETKERLKKEADIEAKRTKLELLAEEKRTKRQLDREYKKEFSKADIFEKNNINQIRTDARSAQAKLKAKEMAETDVLDGRLARERAHANSQAEKRKAEQLERTERKRLRDKFNKLETAIEKEAGIKIMEIQKRAKAMRDDVTLDHKKSILNAEAQKRQRYNQTEKERVQGNKAAEKAERDILGTQIPMPGTEDDEKML